ncbi:MAG: hypothetical protein ABEJ85_03625 [Haloarculaceae archaeon]
MTGGAGPNWIPPAPRVYTLTQPDGTAFRARRWGDGERNGVETVAGYTILRNATTGWWHYAAKSDGRLVPTE